MTFCPSCGYNLARDETIERDSFKLDPRGVVLFNDEYLPLTKAEALLLHTLASAGDRFVSRTTAGQRLGDADDPANVATVLLHRVRSRLKGYGVPCPIETRVGLGYRWAGAQ